MTNRFAIPTITLIAVTLLVIGRGQAIAQGGGGSGGSSSAAGGGEAASGSATGGDTSGTSDSASDASDTSGAVGSGNVTTGTSSTQAGAGANASSNTGQESTKENSGRNLNQTGPNQETDNLLLESPGAQSQTETQNPALRPFDGQDAARTNQANQPNQNPARRTAGTAQQQSLFNGTNGPSLDQVQRDALATIGLRESAGRGLIVETLGPGSIFYDRGLRPGDVILGINNQPVRSEAEFDRLLLSQWGQRTPATVWRNGRQETIYLTFSEGTTDRQFDRERSRPYHVNRPDYSSGGPGFLGVAFGTDSFNTAIVRDVLPGSAAEQAGLREGDVILALNGQPVNSFPEAMRMIGSMQAGDSLDIEFTRRVSDHVQARLGGRPTSGPSATGAAGEQPIDGERVYRAEPQVERQSIPQAEPQRTEQREAIPLSDLPSDANRAEDLP